VSFSNIATLFKPFYYTSVPATTYRALLNSDLTMDSKLVLDCSSLTGLAGSGGFLKNVLMMACGGPNGQASQAGGESLKVNFGAAMLMFLEMSNESRILDALVLFFLVFFVRLLAFGMYRLKLWRAYRLKEEKKRA
jgi:hypothetical protein